MLQLQEANNWKKPAATTWAAEFLLRENESRQFLGSWINSSAVHEEKTSQASDHVFISMWEVAKHSWSSCESGVRTLQKGEKHGPENDRRPPNRNSGAHSSAGCKAQKRSVIGAHNRCWKYLIGDITMMMMSFICSWRKKK